MQSDIFIDVYIPEHSDLYIHHHEDLRYHRDQITFEERCYNSVQNLFFVFLSPKPERLNWSKRSFVLLVYAYETVTLYRKGVKLCMYLYIIIFSLLLQSLV
jgi:hypothetical protein